MSELDDVADLSPDQRRAMLSRLLVEEAQASASSHPLSYGQQSMWFLHQLEPGSPAYTITYAGRISGDLDVMALTRTIEALVQRHAILRTTYAMRDGKPVQFVHPRWPVQLAVCDVNRCTGELQDWLRRESSRPFDLQTGPVFRCTLLRLARDEHVLVWAIHHIAVDFWSMDLLLHELRFLHVTQPDPSPPEAHRYVNYVDWQRDMLAGPDGQRLWDYWRNQLAGELPFLRLPTDRPRRSVQTYHGAVRPLTVDRELTAALKVLARNLGATTYTTILAAYATLLHRYSGHDDICIGSPFAGRDRPEVEDLVGYLINPLVLRMDLRGDPPFAAFLGRTKQVVLGALEHQDYPLALLVERLRPARDHGQAPLFQVSFAWEQTRRFQQEPSAAVAGAPAALSLQTVHLGQGGAPADLTLLLGEVDDELTGVLQYNTDLFDETTIERMVGHLLTLLRGIAAAPDRRLSELPLLTRPELEQRRAWNETSVIYDEPACVHEIIAESACRNGDSVALWCDGRETTYSELDSRADGLANRLQHLGVGPNVIVPVLLDRSQDLIVALLGVLKAGGAIMPLDPDQPANRIATMLADVQGAPVCVTQRIHRDRLTGSAIHLLCVDDPCSASTPGRSVRAGATADDLAYVIYTSGSTGIPKGALNTHRGTRNRMLWMRDNLGLTNEDNVLFKTPVSFDACLLEVLWPLVTGARVVIAKPDGHKDDAYLARLVAEQSVTAIYMVPSLLQPLLAKLKDTAYRGLKIISSVGEVLPYELAQRILATTDATLWNEYGPTECSAVTTAFQCKRGELLAPIPIGQPLANVRTHLLDDGLAPVPVGVSAELYIGGDGVARGYLNRPEETAARFIPDPYAARTGQMLYKTGDLARYLPDGNIEYLGRIDHQVKIRGVRIELGEVEAALGKHPRVGHNVVVAEDDHRGTTRLVAHVVAASDIVPTASELRRFLLEQLPVAVLPAAFHFTQALPLTPNGKVDRRALTSGDRVIDQRGPQFVAPRNNAERLLAEIWCDVLDLDRVGVFDDFFDLGGASSGSLQIAVRANDAGLPLTPQSLFIHGTIAELAAEYGRRGEDRSGSGGDEQLTDSHTGSEPGQVRTVGARAARTAINSAGSEPRNTVIESLGVYLPAEVLTTEAVLAGCHKEVGVPLERLTGIHSRRVVAPDEYSIDLARLAMDDCFSRSSHQPSDIDLVIACNLSRCDGPNHKFSYEPSTAARLRDQCGLQNALAFDVSNACAGMFTGITVADAYLKTGLARTAMVVSGEYASHLVDTAQKEIEGPMDPRMACLTVGDAGAAVILERGPNNLIGFHDIDMATLGRYSSLCIGRVTDQPHGGATMVVDSIGVTMVAVQHLVPYVDAIMRRNDWRPDHCDHIIIHQTSEASLRDGMTTFNRMYGSPVAHPGNVINNLAERGNTVSTTHFVALSDFIHRHRIRSGDTLVFGISGSGQTLGGALYTLDDLPDRLRRASDGHRRRGPSRAPKPIGQPPVRVLAEAIGFVPEDPSATQSVQMAVQAAQRCMHQSQMTSAEIGLIIHTGVYRDDYIAEPPVAAFVANGLGVTAEVKSADDPKTLAFDLLNGGVGFLDACHAATQMIGAGKVDHALIVASEIENNSAASGRRRYGLAQTASAMVLSRTTQTTGFGRFVFHHHGEHGEALTTYTQYAEGQTWLQINRAENLTELYCSFIPAAVEELLASEDLDPSDVSVVLLPALSSPDRARLADAIGIPVTRFVDPPPDGDPFTSTIPQAFQHVRTNGLVQPGDIGLIISAGSGIQIGCATYRF